MIAVMDPNRELRVRNPFSDSLVTEIIEDPVLYRSIFSEEILVGETLSVFQPLNVVLAGPQGSGKSMLLNLIRYQVLSQWFLTESDLPQPLRHVAPFLGISINLERANLHTFGRRSVSELFQSDPNDYTLDLLAAADFLNHYLFREFLIGLRFILSDESQAFARWLGIQPSPETVSAYVREMASWDEWYGYYSRCRTLDSLIRQSEVRLGAWRRFLNANTDEIPKHIWQSKSTLGEPLHLMGNLLKKMSGGSKPVSLYVVIDQYEILVELNPTHGTSLQRMVNSLLKRRDPVAFYKLGARTYDWGNELRVWGANSFLELQRDYVMVDLGALLVRGEDPKSWLFPQLASDVAFRRLKQLGKVSRDVNRKSIEQLFGRWSAEKESRLYFRSQGHGVRIKMIGKEVPSRLAHIVDTECGNEASPLTLRLAGAWALQQLRGSRPIEEIEQGARSEPWQREWWKKERVEVALLQLASIGNQRKHYFGWRNVLYLSGGSISAFLLICSEVWDLATRLEHNPLKGSELSYDIQSEGIYKASAKWRLRDRIEQQGGRRRYDVIVRLSSAIRRRLISDFAISNPGHSGFSLREEAIVGVGAREPGSHGEVVANFLRTSVSWAILEERPHTSKLRNDTARRKWYLHPLLSPVIGVPHIRVKEPLYSSVDEVYKWIESDGTIAFGHEKTDSKMKERRAASVENQDSQHQEDKLEERQLKLPLGYS